MERLLTEEVIAILLTVLMVLAMFGMVIITAIIIQIIEEDFRNERSDKKNHK